MAMAAAETPPAMTPVLVLDCGDAVTDAAEEEAVPSE
jgi:hypothetical protein